MLQNNALIDTDTARIYLGNSDTNNTSFLELAINTLSDTFDAFVGYQIIEKEYSGVVLNGTGNRLLRFPSFHVSACTQIEYRSTFTLWKTLPDTLWELDAIHHRGAVGFGSFTFSSGIQNWRADYTAGWAQDDIPGTIREAFLYELKRFVERRPDTESENMGGQSASGRSYIPLRDTTRKALSAYMLQSI